MGMLAATTHIRSDNSETTMEQYIFKKKTDGINIINLKKTWEKLLLAARAIAAVENPQDMLGAAPLLVVSPPEHLPIRSRLLSVSPDCFSLVIPELTISR